MNEDELIKKYVKSSQSKEVVLGHGDDCSVIDFDADQFLIGTTDSLIEQVHFRLSDISFMQLGYKALAVNISDISAMGGTPRWAHLSLAFPPTTAESAIADFFTGFYGLASPYNIQLVGGNMCAAPEGLNINIHLSGLVPKKQIQYRSGFAKADTLCVTGSLGDSAAGLECLLLNHGLASGKNLVHRHLTPPIEIAKAQWLARQPSVHGMMDLSDGLQTDLKRIPNCGFEIAMGDIPHTPDLIEFCEKFHKDIYQYSIAGGEDYVLLFGCQHAHLADLQKRYANEFGQAFYPIGRISEGQGVRYFLGAQEQKLNYQSFEHFRV